MQNTVGRDRELRAAQVSLQRPNQAIKQSSTKMQCAGVASVDGIPKLSDIVVHSLGGQDESLDGSAARDERIQLIAVSVVIDEILVRTQPGNYRRGVDALNRNERCGLCRDDGQCLPRFTDHLDASNRLVNTAEAHA